MKSVLISIQPKWCELIASGKKTIEVRKTKPKLETPFKCYIYCTKGREPNVLFRWCKSNNFLKAEYTALNGKVIGEFICDDITHFEGELWDDETFERICEVVEPCDFDEYGEYEYITVATNEEDNYDENWLCKQSCVSWEELRKYMGGGINEFYGWHISNLAIYDKPRELGEFRTVCEGLKPCQCDKCEYSYTENTESGSYAECCCNNLKPLKRPPQSWCYVESEVEGK